MITVSKEDYLKAIATSGAEDEMLHHEGIRPGARIALYSKNYDGTTTLGIGKRSFRLGAPAARKIWVKKA